MKKALRDLKKQTTKIKKPKKISENVWRDFVENTTVVLMAGGESSRFSEVTKGTGVNKNAFRLPNGDSMIEMAIRMYKEAGFKNFVASVFHNATSIEDTLGNGSKFGVEIIYSYDPEIPVGKGGAIKNAVLNGSIPKNNYCIIHNPDDVIVGFPGSFPRHIVEGHLYGKNKKTLATVVVVEETPYAYTGMKVVNNIVTQVEMYPFIPIPTHVGVTILSPDTYPYFDKHFDLSKKADFESVLLPVLAKENKLSAVSIPDDCWIAVNNAKSFKELVKRIEKSSSDTKIIF